MIDLILMLINSKGSSTYNNSVQTIDLFYEEYPKYRDILHIHSFDGMGYNALYGSPVVQTEKNHCSVPLKITDIL